MTQYSGLVRGPRYYPTRKRDHFHEDQNENSKKQLESGFHRGACQRLHVGRRVFAPRHTRRTVQEQRRGTHLCFDPGQSRRVAHAFRQGARLMSSGATPAKQAKGTTMICQIYPVSYDESRYQWKWRCKDGKQKSSRSFDLFYECVEDARKHGGEVDLAHVHEEIAQATLNVKIVSEGVQKH
jgi:hypothetical protein